MRVNIFEGARRIAKLIAVFWVIAVGVYTATLPTPTIPLRFNVSSPNEAPAPTEDQCDLYDRVQTRRFQARSGTIVSAEYCFRAQKNSTGGYVIPFQANPDKTWRGASNTSNEVKVYAMVAASEFTLGYADEQRADAAVWQKLKDDVLKAAAAVVAGWLVLWATTKTIGWIVRGFAGIPAGEDHRPADLSPEA